MHMRRTRIAHVHRGTYAYTHKACAHVVEECALVFPIFFLAPFYVRVYADAYVLWSVRASLSRYTYNLPSHGG